MKKRNTTIFAFLLLAAVGMGVGYAAFSQEFDVNGTVKVNTSQAEEEFKKEIIFTNATAEVQKAGGVAAGENPTTATIDAGAHSVTWTINALQAKGDKCIGTFTITNNSDLAAKIDAYALTNDHSDLFSVTVANIANENVIAAKTANDDTDTLTFTVTVEMLKDPTATEDYTFNVGFNAVLG